MKHIHIIPTAAVLALLMTPTLAMSQQAADTVDDPNLTDGTGSNAGVTGGSTDGGDTGASGGGDGTNTTSNEGAYDALSPGGQKIANALAKQQPEPADDAGTSVGADGPAGTPVNAGLGPLSVDDIAVRKQDGQGWGQVFKSMQAEGLTTEKNLGQVISKSNRRHVAATEPGTTDTGASGPTATNPTTAAPSSSAVNSQSGNPRPVVISLGNGSSMTVGGGNANAYGRTSARTQAPATHSSKSAGSRGISSAGSRGNGNTAFVTGSGGNGNGNTNGNAYGHSNAGSRAGASANAGIVSAAGGNAGAQAGANAGVTTAGGHGNAVGNGNGKAKGHNK